MRTQVRTLAYEVKHTLLLLLLFWGNFQLGYYTNQAYSEGVKYVWTAECAAVLKS